MKKWLMAVLFIAALVLGACGGATDDNAADETTDDAATEEPAENNDAGTEDEAGTEDDATTEEGDAEGGAIDVAAAEEVYKQNCQACHGADLSGGAGPALDNIGSKLSADEIADIIVNGKGAMGPQNVQGEDLDILSNWLASLK